MVQYNIRWLHKLSVKLIKHFYQALLCPLVNIFRPNKCLWSTFRKLSLATEYKAGRLSESKWFTYPKEGFLRIGRWHIPFSKPYKPFWSRNYSCSVLSISAGVWWWGWWILFRCSRWKGPRRFHTMSLRLVVCWLLGSACSRLDSHLLWRMWSGQEWSYRRAPGKMR